MRGASVRTSALVGEDQVLGRWARPVLGQRQDMRVDRLVHRRLSLVVLALVLLPAVDQVVLDETVRVGDVLAEGPAFRAGGAARAAKPLHLRPELLVVLWGYAVLDRDEHRAV